MDSSADAMLCSNANRRGAGKRCVNTLNMLRCSRSLEYRAPVDAPLRLHPSYKDENEALQSVRGEREDDLSEEGNVRTGTSWSPLQSAASAPARTWSHEQQPIVLQYASQIAGRDFLADLQILERKEAEKRHIIMLNL